MGFLGGEMVASMNPSDVTIPLRDVSQENGVRNLPSEQGTPSHNEGSGRNEQNVGRCRRSKYAIAAVIILVVALVISAVFNIIYSAQIGRLEERVEELEAQLQQLEAVPTSEPLLNTSCPPGWTRNVELCYFFSDTESTWDSALNNCSSFGGSLCAGDTQLELTFVNKNKATTEYWLGLRREDIVEPWKKPDGTLFNNAYEIKGKGPCASLNDDVFSSTNCDSLRHWICSKPVLISSSTIKHSIKNE